MSLYHKFRPRKLESVIGQDAAVSSLQRLMEKGMVPHVVLLSGPSGCGKTTIARILKDHLGCGEQDFMEINCADFKGIDMVRDIRRHSGLSPISGDCRVWLIDEAHKLTNDAQNALLKLLEDTPSHVYFFLATTDPHKLIKTIHTRCSEVRLGLLTQNHLKLLIAKVAKREGFQLTDDVVASLVEAAEGSARKALVLLEQVAHLADEDSQLAAITSASVNKDQAIELARKLINPRSGWSEVAAILKDIKDEPENVRYLVLGYARSVMLGGGPLAPRAFMLIDIFGRNFYDSKQAGLAAACWEAIHPAK